MMVTRFRKNIFSTVEIRTTKNVERKIHRQLILKHVADLDGDDGDDLDKEEVDDDENNFEEIHKKFFFLKG